MLKPLRVEYYDRRGALLKTLQQRFGADSMQKLDIKVRPSARARARQRRRATMSPEAAADLRAAADATTDQQLRAALLRLSSRAGRSG